MGLSTRWTVTSPWKIVFTALAAMNFINTGHEESILGMKLIEGHFQTHIYGYHYYTYWTYKRGKKCVRLHYERYIFTWEHMGKASGLHCFSLSRINLHWAWSQWRNTLGHTGNPYTLDFDSGRNGRLWTLWPVRTLKNKYRIGSIYCRRHKWIT